MSKRTKRFLIAAIISIVFSVGAVLIIVPSMFSAQYNNKGISHFLVIAIDNNVSKTYLGELEDHKVYIERLNIEETNFRSIKAENVSIREVLDKKLITINELKKYAFRLSKQGQYEVLKYDNYEIAINDEELIIRPLNK